MVVRQAEVATNEQQNDSEADANATHRHNFQQRSLGAQTMRAVTFRSNCS